MAGRTITIVLGGGRGSRLYPLTSVRAKPAVPVGGKYRLIDIPISNAINSRLREIYVLTQFNSASLNAHVTKTYRFDAFSHGTVEILAAEQTDTSGDWYQGTADAVRQHLHRLKREGVDNVLILSGDHLYRMDYRELITRHRDTDAHITISTIPLSRADCTGFGVMSVDEAGIVTGFREKPDATEDISELEMSPARARAWDVEDKPFLASMGVYVFRLDTLVDLLSDVSLVDFGRDILPSAIHTHRVAAHVFHGYWEDIGTVSAFYSSNLMLCEDEPPFHFYDTNAPMYTRPRFLPPSVMRDIHVEQAIIAEGCLLFGAEIVHSVIGLRARLMPGCRIADSIIMGSDFYDSPKRRRELAQEGRIPIGIGENASIRHAIIDKNARIGRGAIIHGNPDRPDEDHPDWVARDGIVIVKKGATIPAGAVL